MLPTISAIPVYDSFKTMERNASVEAWPLDTFVFVGCCIRRNNDILTYTSRVAGGNALESPVSGITAVTVQAAHAGTTGALAGCRVT